jgi:hypothetical protein
LVVIAIFLLLFFFSFLRSELCFLVDSLGLSAKFYHHLALLYKEKLNNLQRSNKEKEEKGKQQEDDVEDVPSALYD